MRRCRDEPMGWQVIRVKVASGVALITSTWEGSTAKIRSTW